MKKLLRILIGLLVLVILIFLFYCNNLALANKETVSYYKELKKILREKGYKTRLLVISTKRLGFHNKIQVNYSGAASKSRHLKGDAIDFLVFDINNDGKRNSIDVNIVTEILEKEIMKGKGGIGTYINEPSFIDRQMVHIDCRNGKGRWSR
ncbi:MAG TPA: hypothetical protein VIS75_04625 [Chitinophagaceae bacterium]|jgi:uncharacterized protein YcbK (DUF882 family)